MKKIGLMLFVGLFLAGAAWAGTVEMVLYGLSGREREEDWRVLGEGLVEKGVRVESTDAERAVLRFTYHPGRVGRLYSGFFEPEWIVSELVKSSLRKGRVEVLD